MHVNPQHCAWHISSTITITAIIVNKHTAYNLLAQEKKKGASVDRHLVVRDREGFSNSQWT